MFFGLWLTGIELDISALMGLTMVIGMLTELAIFLLAEIDPNWAIDIESLIEVGHARLRPILMSALIAILTLAPLALGSGVVQDCNARWPQRSSSGWRSARRWCCHQRCRGLYLTICRAADKSVGRTDRPGRAGNRIAALQMRDDRI